MRAVNDQWLWLIWQSGRHQCKRCEARIQSLPKFKHNMWLLLTTYWNDKIKKKEAGNCHFFNKKMWTRTRDDGGLKVKKDCAGLLLWDNLQMLVKMGHSRPLFLYFRLFNIVDSKMLNIMFCWWLNLNREPLELEVTTLPTEPQPLPPSTNCFLKPHSHRNGFYWGHQCSWTLTLTPANSVQVPNMQDYDPNRK